MFCQFDNLYRLLDLLSEHDPSVMVTVRKYAAASLLEVFKDLLPGYRLQEHDLTQKLKKETIATYKYENALINSYKKYLIKLEEYTKTLGSDQTPLKVSERDLLLLSLFLLFGINTVRNYTKTDHRFTCV